MYLTAVLVLPAVAVGAEQISRRSRVGTVAVLAMGLIPIIPNATGPDQPLFGSEYFAEREALLRTTLRMPFIDQVPGDIRPTGDLYDGAGLAITAVQGKRRASPRVVFKAAEGRRLLCDA